VKKTETNNASHLVQTNKLKTQEFRIAELDFFICMVTPSKKNQRKFLKSANSFELFGEF